MSRKQPLHFSHSPHPTTHTHTYTHTHTRTHTHTHLPPSFLLSSVHLSQRRYHLHRPSEEFQERSRQDRTEQDRTGQDVQHATPLLVLCRHMSPLTTAGTSDTCTPTAHSVGTMSGSTTPRVASAGFPLDKAVSRQDRRRTECRPHSSMRLHNTTCTCQTPFPLSST